MKDLVDFALSRVNEAIANRDYATAEEWLDSVPPDQRPAEIICEIAYESAKAAVALGAWVAAESRFETALRGQKGPLAQSRIGLLRKRRALPSGDVWGLLDSKIDPADRLPSNLLRPEVDEVYACGAYYAWSKKGAPWSRFVRLSKAKADADHDAAVALGAGYMSRFVFERTTLLREVDAVVPVPPHPGRYAERGFSLPQDLARGIEAFLGVPCLTRAVVHTGKDVELRGLGRADRRDAVRGAFSLESLDVSRFSRLLLVDDVVTSGATFRELGRLLREAGASAVYAVALAHTEG